MTNVICINCLDSVNLHTDACREFHEAFFACHDQQRQYRKPHWITTITMHSIWRQSFDGGIGDLL